MFENEDLGSEESFLSSSQGKKILIMGFILVVVIGMIFVTYMMQKKDTAKTSESEQEKSNVKQADQKESPLEKTQKKWKTSLKQLDESAEVSFDKPPLKGVLSVVGKLNQNDLAYLFFKNRKRGVPTNRLKKGNPEDRGTIVQYSGTLKSIADSARTVDTEETGALDLHEVTIQNKQKGLTYRLFLLQEPPEKAKTGRSILEGEALYVNTIRKSGTDQKEKEQPIVVLLSIKSRLSKIAQGKDGQEGDEPSETGKENDRRAVIPPDLPSPEKFKNREQVMKRWGRLLQNIDDQKPLQAGSPVYNRLIRDIKQVPEKKFNEWATTLDDPTETLKNRMGNGNFRGRIVSFSGTFMTGKKLPVAGEPNDGNGVWTIWLRDFENKITYAVHMLEKPDFYDKMKMKPVKGTGVYIQTTPYELKDGPRKGAQSIAVYLIGQKLQPNPDAAGSGTSNPWLKYILGGLAILFLGVFIIVVYISTRGDVEGQSTIRKKLRKNRDKQREKGRGSGNADSTEDEDTSSS